MALRDFSELRGFLHVCGVDSCPNMDEANDMLRFIKNDAIRNAIVVMVSDLYDPDLDALKSDAARITFADWKEDVRPEPEERQKLMRVLWWIFSVYFEGDYGRLLSMCMSRLKLLHPD